MCEQLMSMIALARRSKLYLMREMLVEARSAKPCSYAIRLATSPHGISRLCLAKKADADFRSYGYSKYGGKRPRSTSFEREEFALSELFAT
jgi:hypothetical protein